MSTDSMTIEQKLDYIIQLLEQRQQRRPRKHAERAKAAPDVLEAVQRAVRRLPPGRFTANQIACAAGLPDGMVAAIAIGKAMDELGYRRFRSGKARGFIVPVPCP